MALKVVSMEELKLEVLLEPERTGETVAEVCARRGLSRGELLPLPAPLPGGGRGRARASLAPAALLAGADRAFA
jgi:hypothetical protein